MKTKIKLTLTLFAILFSPLFWRGAGGEAFANNLQIGAPTLPSTTSIQFTIQWDNSWKVSSGSTNYDAVWVFVKYQNCTNQLWNHVSVTGSSVTGGVLQIDNTADTKGVFIRRTADGNGSIASSTVTLNMTSVTDAGYNYQVFAVEMVYIPTGSFWVGDGASGDRIGTCNGIQQITSNGITPTLTSTSNCGGFTLPAVYPEGYDAFYCMKYEITQEQYVSFLNALTYDQQVNRTAVSPTSPANTYAMTVGAAMQNRNGIRIMTPGIFNSTPAVYACDFTAGGGYNQTNDGQNIACNWMCWDDLTAYLDWAALRPMSELEYEKACRGTVVPVANGYPWDNATINSATSAVLTGGTSGFATETSTSTADGLCAYNGAAALGPLRVGFAATGTTGRTGAGATYYGVMDMGGNVAEQAVAINGIVNASTASAYTTAIGDGTLISAPAATAGNSNTANTPSYLGTVSRGGTWNEAATYVPTSYRRGYLANGFQFRNQTTGGRGVRRSAD